MPAKTTAETVRAQNARAERKETATSLRKRCAEAIGALMANLAENERAIGRLLIEAKATYPATQAGRAAFQSWAEEATGRRYGMVKRWITAATVLQRVPSFAAVSTKADTCQMVSGLPDEDIAAIAATFEGKPATEEQVKRAMLRVSETAQKREAKRLARESEAAKSTRVRNDAAIEGFVRRGFGKLAEDLALCIIEAETDPQAGVIHFGLIVADYCNVGLKGRAVRAMIAKYESGDHVKENENENENED